MCPAECLVYCKILVNVRFLPLRAVASSSNLLTPDLGQSIPFEGCLGAGENQGLKGELLIKILSPNHRSDSVSF